ncbi:MAG: hypothetical protein L0956_09490 [Candidatus Mariimomonas ferrooxydans]
MPRSYFFINLFLLIIIALLGYSFLKVLANPLNIPFEAAQQIQADKKDTMAGRQVNLNEAAYLTIVEKDLFRPSRTDPKTDNGIQISNPSELIKLFGTIIMNNEKIAILEDPSTKKTKPYHINDSLSGFVITDIQKDKIIVLRGDEKIEVKLRNMKGFTTPSSTSATVPKPSVKPKKPKNEDKVLHEGRHAGKYPEPVYLQHLILIKEFW